MTIGSIRIMLGVLGRPQRLELALHLVSRWHPGELDDGGALQRISNSPKAVKRIGVNL